MYRRADLSRTAAPVVAPFSTANAVALELPVADAQSLSMEERGIVNDADIRSGGRFIREVE